MDIKEYVKKSLEHNDILNLLGDKKVFFLHATTPTTPYIEYEIVAEYGEDYAENEETHTSYTIQVDIFSKGNYSEIEKQVKKHMKLNGFCRELCVDLYEDDTKLYHKAMRFNITKED